MLTYPNQPKITLFNNATLTAAYAGNRKEFTTKGFSKVTLDVTYAMGGAESANTLEFQLEASTDKINWHSLVIDSTTTVSAISPRAWQMSASSLSVLVDIAYIEMRLSIKETGVAVNFGTATVVATLSGL